jgi:MFS family permease
MLGTSKSILPNLALSHRFIILGITLYVNAFLDRSRSIAGPRYNRWLVPPAALSIHLAVGQAYAFSVFNIPLTHQIGITGSARGDWSLTTIAWVFSVAIVFLGLSAAVFGKWLEAAGPRKAMFASACCFGAGFIVAAAGVSLHQFWLLLLGYGGIGGIGLGIGYISPVSTLIKWFPDRPGMATGMAIMGFGGGAMIGSPLGVTLMKLYASSGSTGVAPAFVTMGALYSIFMMFGVFTVRLPAGSERGGAAAGSREASVDHTADEAVRMPQFWLLWVVLFVNVSAGIAVLSQASPMIQEVFSPRVSAAAAAGFVGLLSLFNLAGRFAWAFISDYIGRRRTYFAILLLGIVLYGAIPMVGRGGSIALFVACFAVILSMYGGGFATIPAYLRDLFGTAQVGAIHGRLLTAWSAAGIAGPLLISQLRAMELARHAPLDTVYHTTMWTLALLLVPGVICNALVRRTKLKQPTDNAPTKAASDSPDYAAASATSRSTNVAALAAVWLFVGVPLVWGVSQTVMKSMALFR